MFIRSFELELEFGFGTLVLTMSDVSCSSASAPAESLDGKEITDAYRTFAQNLNRTRDASNERSSFIAGAGTSSQFGSSILPRAGLVTTGSAPAGFETGGSAFGTQSSPVRPARELGAPNEFYASPSAGAAAARLYGASVRANRVGSAKHALPAGGTGESSLAGGAADAGFREGSPSFVSSAFQGSAAEPQPEELQVLSLRPSLAAAAAAAAFARQASSGSPPPPLPPAPGLTALRERAAEEQTAEAVHLPEIGPPARRVSFAPPAGGAPPTSYDEAENEP